MNDLVTVAEQDVECIDETNNNEQNLTASFQQSVDVQSASDRSATDNEVEEAFAVMFGEYTAMVDKESFSTGYKAFLNTNLSPSNNDEVDTSIVHKRLVKDIFHLMDMIRPYKKHTLYKELSRRFSDSLSVFDEEDKRVVAEALEINGS